jgi:hypothetical protein
VECKKHGKKLGTSGTIQRKIFQENEKIQCYKCISIQLGSWYDQFDNFYGNTIQISGVLNGVDWGVKTSQIEVGFIDINDKDIVL